MLKSITSFLVILFISTSTFSQVATDTTSTRKKSLVTLNSGEEIVGNILSDDGREILIINENIGKLYISKVSIKSIKELIGDVKPTGDGDLILEGPFTTRYSFTTNALPIKKNVNYAMINLYGPEIHFALTNRLSLGVMSTWIGSPFAMVGKYTLKSKEEELNFAVGGIIGTSGYLMKASRYGGLCWGIVTVGNRIDNISFSAGYGFFGNRESDNPNVGGLIASIAGITKIGKKASLIFDSMFSYSEKNASSNNYNSNGTDKVKNYTIFFMPGFRFQSTENKAFQVSLAGVLASRDSKTTSFPIPMCSWLYKL